MPLCVAVDELLGTIARLGLVVILSLDTQDSVVVANSNVMGAYEFVDSAWVALSVQKKTADWLSAVFMKFVRVMKRALTFLRRRH
jgi:hypothetical protein